MNEVELERRLCVVEDRSKSNSHRLKTVEERQEDMTQLVTSVAAIAQKQLDMDEDVKEIKTEVKAINLKPAKRWWKAAAVRAVKTVAQTAVATIGTAAMLDEVNWLMVGSAALLAGVLSLLTSVGGLPEVEEVTE